MRRGTDGSVACRGNRPPTANQPREAEPPIGHGYQARTLRTDSPPTYAPSGDPFGQMPQVQTALSISSQRTLQDSNL